MKQDLKLESHSEMFTNEDVIYELILNNKEVVNNLFDVNDYKIKKMCSYLSDIHSNYGENVYIYFEAKVPSKSLEEIRIDKIFLYYALTCESLEKEKYKKLFDRYIEYGILYIEKTYNKDVIGNVLYYYMKSEEDTFLLYMCHAEENRNNGVTYLKYLKEALLACPEMKKGIQILYKNMEEKLNKAEEEMNEYKRKIMETISSLINTNDLSSARTIIAEYETIGEADIDLITMKAIIEIMENNLQVAEGILSDGIKKYGDNFDLIYNIAYLYDLMDDKKRSVYFYKKAMLLTKDKNFMQDITDKLKV
jgi:hypothetical protein